MRLIHYINEEQEGIATSFDAEFLKNKCADYIRKDPMFPKNPFVRDIRSSLIRKMQELSGITNELSMMKLHSYIDVGRRPLDIKQDVHDYLNKKFREMFGWNARDGVFALRKRNYSYFCICMPVGNIKYVWSPKSRDLYVDLKEKNDNEVAELIKSFKDNNIDEIDNQEIMFNCKEYYSIFIEEGSDFEKFKEEMR